MEHPAQTPLRILQIIHYLHTGGLEQLALRLASAYRKLGHESHVLAYESGPMLSQFQAQGIITHVLPRPQGASLRYLFQLAGFLRYHRFDIVHTHHIGPMLYGIPAARLCRMIAIHTTHSQEHLYPKGQSPHPEANVPSQRKLYQHLARLCHHITTVNTPLQQYLQNNLHIKTPVTAISNGVDPNVFHGQYDVTSLRQTLAIPQDAPWIGTVGRLAPEKGHRYLIEAMRLIPNPPHLLVIGDGPLRQELTALAQSLGLSSHIHFLGLRQDLPELLTTLELLILPSLREGLPLTLLEALASGIPVIATDTGNVKEILDQSQGGLTVSPGNAPELMQSITSLLLNTTRRQHMSSTAKRWIQTHYNQQDMIQRYVSLYQHYHPLLQKPDWLKPIRHAILSLFTKHTP